jgi:uncharacterized protein (TIGR03382 family)
VRRKHMRFLSFAAIASLALLPAAFGGTIVLNENFDELTATLGVTSAGAFSTTGGSNVDIVGPGDGFGALCAAPESGNCIDMDGSGGDSAGQLQSNTAFANGIYLLSFDLIGSQRGSSSSVTVTFGNYSMNFNLLTGDDTTGIVINQLVTVSGGVNPNLVFSSQDATTDDVGLLLDNVCVVTNPISQNLASAQVAPAVSGCSAATPEPASGLLMLAGLPLLWFARRLTR